MKTSDILREAKKKIDAPEKWTQGVGARDSSGEQVSPWSDGAVCFCGYGALWAIDGTNKSDAEERLDYAVDCDFPRWNDTPGRTHAEVMDAFDRAIALAEADEAKAAA